VPQLLSMTFIWRIRKRCSYKRVKVATVRLAMLVLTTIAPRDRRPSKPQKLTVM